MVVMPTMRQQTLKAKPAPHNRDLMTVILQKELKELSTLKLRLLFHRFQNRKNTFPKPHQKQLKNSKREKVQGERLKGEGEREKVIYCGTLF